MNSPRIAARPYSAETARSLAGAGVHPVLARVYAARGVSQPGELDTRLEGLLSPGALLHAETMARILADAIERRQRITIVADYDADGATACAVGLRALSHMGAAVDYVVPDRFRFGYGLTPEIARLAIDTRKPDLLVTVDNGIASVEGVAEANRLGVGVLVTDHHLPGDRLPDAACIVNPNQPGCGFPSKNLAGVGVMFYVMLALRAELRARGAFANRPEPNLAALLDLVALGTVADVVRLDANNRILVHQGLARIRAGRCCAGVRALYAVSGRDPARACAQDLGFALGPRLNAAGRLTDMSLGIECLATDDADKAQAIAGELDKLNRERRDIEQGMRQQALAEVESADFGNQLGVSLFNAHWHQGVIGILAARVRERLHRPTIAFAPGGDDELKGSGRSIDGFHLRDALDLVAKRHPGLILRFGGHASAAGLSIRGGDFERFQRAFDDTARELLDDGLLQRVIETDGGLGTTDATLDMAQTLAGPVWGQGFPPPQFDDAFAVRAQRIVGERHRRLTLARDGCSFDAILFNHPEPLPGAVRAVYRLMRDEFRGSVALKLGIEHWEAV